MSFILCNKVAETNTVIGMIVTETKNCNYLK